MSELEHARNLPIPPTPVQHELRSNDDRVYLSLQEQLRDAHATSADLRERLGDVERREKVIDAKLSEANVIGRQLESAHAKQKAAEDNAAAAQRKCEDAEREALRARGEPEELREQLERL